jgi:hypothetical protein
LCPQGESQENLYKTFIVGGYISPFFQKIMSTKFFSAQTNIEELVAQILMDRKISYTDQQLLKSALLFGNALDEQERTLIDRIFYGVRHGLLHLVE